MKRSVYSVAVQEVVENLAKDMLHGYPIMREYWNIASLTWFIEELTNFRGNNSIIPMWDFALDTFSVIPNVTENNVFYFEVVRIRNKFAVPGCRVFLIETGDRSFNRPT